MSARAEELLGLTSAEAARRLANVGPNRPRPFKREPLREAFLEELREPLILLLLATGALYSVWGGLGDAVTIFVVILTLIGVEVGNERRAGHAIDALRELSEPNATVLRDGHPAEVPSEAIVPGDVIVLRAGRRVAADARLLETQSLELDESTMTGESVPVAKVEAAAVLAGTMVTRGRGHAEVTATGPSTELGRLAQLAREAKPRRTPLQLAMEDLSRWLVGVALAFSVLVPALGVWIVGEPVKQMVLVGLSLAFATIPEEMPIIITMVLALGGYRLSRENAVVKRLQAVETLGAVTLIATDKTGTLTENRMRLESVEPPDLETMLLELGVLCNDVELAGDRISGDPVDAALVRAALERGIDVRTVRITRPVVSERSFDDARKLMSVVVSDRAEGGDLIAKGAPEAVLARSATRRGPRGDRELDDEARSAIAERMATMAAGGLRVLAIAMRSGATRDPLGEGDEPEADLTFIGLLGLADPPRPEARGAIAACRAAGVRPIMVTGDHPLTARAIADAVGLTDGDGRILTGPELDRLSDDELAETLASVDVFARTTPEQKLRVVRAAIARGEIVAATGDGVNDAPALAVADVGVAMGETGTDVAREAADVVLADDDFATIVRAVAEGRVLFANLRKGVRYYLACKLALVCAILVPVLLGVPVPFAPVQIILMELFMDLAASATFVVEPPEGDLMARPPRDPRARFMDRAMVESICLAAAGLFAAVTTAYLATWYSGAGVGAAQTVAFVTWILGHFCLAVELRSEREPIARLGLLSNRPMVLWGAAAIGFVLVAVLVPEAHGLMRTTSLSGAQWALAAGAAFAGTFWMEAVKWLRYARSSRN